MKKIALLIIAILLAVGVKLQITFESLLPEGIEECEVYIAGEVDAKEGWESTQITNMTIFSKKYVGGSIKDSVDGNILGMAVTYKHDKVSTQQILDSLQAKVIKTQKLDNVITYYAYSGLLGGGVEIDNQKVNIQIAYTAQGIKVATPLIMGSY